MTDEESINVFKNGLSQFLRAAFSTSCFLMAQPFIYILSTDFAWIVVKPGPFFRYDGRKGKSFLRFIHRYSCILIKGLLNLGTFKDTRMNNHINGELSTRPFH